MFDIELDESKIRVIKFKKLVKVSETLLKFRQGPSNSQVGRILIGLCPTKASYRSDGVRMDPILVENIYNKHNRTNKRLHMKH